MPVTMLCKVVAWRHDGGAQLGRVIEQGSHEELRARRGLYTSLYGDWAEDVA
jgi:hypothetical protein